MEYFIIVKYYIMPKLFRLTSNADDGLVDVNFKEDINIRSDSKIALKNASFSADDQRFQVTPTNGQMTYVSGTGAAPQVIDLSVVQYSRATANSLLQDIRNKLNQEMTQTSATLGTQWDVSQSGGNTLIEQRICPNDRALFLNYIQPPRGTFTGVQPVAGYDTELDIVGDDYVNDHSQNINSYASLSKGIGVFRTRIHKLNTYATDPSKNGFIMGVSETNPRDWANPIAGNYSLDDLTYYVNVKDQSLAQKIMTKDKGGAEVDTTQSLQNTGNNADEDANIIDIRIQNGQILFDLFKIDTGAAVNLATFTIPDKRQNLYPFLIFRGAQASMELQRIQFLIDPFENDLRPYLGQVRPTEAVLTGLGAKPIPISPTAGAVGRTLAFEDDGLPPESQITQVLGFENNPIVNRNQYRGQFLARSDGVYELAIQNPFYIIRLLNIDIDSWDAEYGSRYNVIATIGPSNSAENVNHSIYYEAPELLYLDIKNSSPRSLRNIKLQILNADLSKPRLDGLTSITLVVN